MHKKFNSDNKAVYLKKRTWILSVSYAKEKTCILTTFSTSCDEFFYLFPFCSKIDQDIYHVEQTFRGTWFLEDFHDFVEIYDRNAKKKKKKKKSCESLLPQPARDDPV